MASSRRSEWLKKSKTEIRPQRRTANPARRPGEFEIEVSIATLKIGMDALEVMICVATVKKISANCARRSSWKKTRGVIFLVQGQRSLRHPRAMFSKRISQKSGRAGFAVRLRHQTMALNSFELVSLGHFVVLGG